MGARCLRRCRQKSVCILKFIFKKIQFKLREKSVKLYHLEEVSSRKALPWNKEKGILKKRFLPEEILDPLEMQI